MIWYHMLGSSVSRASDSISDFLLMCGFESHWLQLFFHSVNDFLPLKVMWVRIPLPPEKPLTPLHGHSVLRYTNMVTVVGIASVSTRIGKYRCYFSHKHQCRPCKWWHNLVEPVFDFRTFKWASLVAIIKVYNRHLSTFWIQFLQTKNICDSNKNIWW